MASRLLTITLNKEHIKISEVEITPQKTVSVYAAATIVTPEGSVDSDGFITDIEKVSNVISEAIDTNGMTRESVIFSMQSAKIMTKEVMAPYIKPAKLAEFIKSNASDYFPVNIEDYLVSHYVLEVVRKDEGKQLKVMAVAVPVTLVAQYYDLAESLEMTVQSLDYANNSNSQLLGLQVDERGSVVIQMGEESTTVCIFHDRVPQLIRTVPYGRNTVANAVMEKRNVTYNDAVWLLTTKPILRTSFSEGDYVTDSLKYMVNNISRVIDYFVAKNPDIPIESACFISEEKGIVGVETLLAEELNIPVEKVDILKEVVLEYNLTVAIGDLTKYITNIGAVIDPVNFVTAEVAEKAKRSNTGRRYKIGLIISLGIAAGLILFPSIKLVTSLVTRGLYQNENAKYEGVEATVEAYYNSKDKYNEILKFKDLATTNNDYLGDFISFLESDMPSDISITSLSVSDGAVTMNCKGKSKDTLASFIDTLKEQKNINNVYVASFSESADYSGAITISYSVVCTFTDFNAETTAETEEVK